MAEQRHDTQPQPPQQQPQSHGMNPLIGGGPAYQQEGGQSVMRPQHPVGTIVPPLSPDEETAEDRERARARTRGVPEAEIAELAARTGWFVSNRADDRVVLYERDPRHPGGEAFIGGSAPERAYRTGNIERLLMSGEIIEVPEPRRTAVMYDPETDSNIEVPHPKRPVDIGIDPGLMRLDAPGQPTRLGRTLDADLWEESEINEVNNRQGRMPRQITPAGSYTPTRSDIERSV